MQHIILRLSRFEMDLPACSKCPPFRYELPFGAIARVVCLRPCFAQFGCEAQSPHIPDFGANKYARRLFFSRKRHVFRPNDLNKCFLANA